MEVDDEPAQMAYAQALADWGDAGGYEFETTVWDTVTTQALGMPFERAQWRAVTSLSGGEQKRVVLEALLSGPADLLLLDEPDNYLDVPAKRWLEDRLIASDKTVLFISHDREPAVAGRHVGRDARAGGQRRDRVDPPRVLRDVARRPGRAQQQARGACCGGGTRSTPRLKALVLMYRTKAAFNDGLASRLHAAETRLAKFEKAGPPEKVAIAQNVTMRLQGGRTAKRAVVCTGVEAPGAGCPRRRRG